MTLREYIKANPNSQISKAAKLADEAHKGQKRLTGEPYIIHPLAVANILFEWKLDETTIIAGLLHDAVEDTPLASERIEKEFGNSVAFIVNGVSKLGRIKYRGAEEEDQAENLRKMIIALSQDLRVVFVKLADRLHNMRTLSALPLNKQRRIALETDEIYAPLAYRLGMQNISGELQDLAFPFLYPREFESLQEKVGDAYEVRRKYATKIAKPLEEELTKNGLKKVDIHFRAKRWSSLYRKLLTHNMDLEKIYDLVALRLIVETMEDCYWALGVIHGMWVPLPGRIKDYIAMPKPNGYRSLHTTVIAPEGKMVEIQIRTREMHEEDENGIAAHWLYKQGKNNKQQNEIKWVSQLRSWQENYAQGSDSKDFLESLKIEFFKHRIFVITPKGAVIDLPAGSTPVDFAYHIHTEIGNSCTGAKVNGEMVHLSHELHSGDMVEILTQKNKKPSEDWLEFVKSSIAKNHIKVNTKRRSANLIPRKK